MTVQPATKMWSRTDTDIKTKDGRKKELRFREGWQVLCDPDDDSEAVSQAADLPQAGDLYPGTTSIMCRNKKLNKISPIFWIVELEYTGEIGPGGFQDFPENRPAEVNWGKVDSTEEIDKDNSGNAIATVNGEPIKGVTKQLSDLVATIKKNYAAVDLAATHQYLHSTNSDTFLGFAAGTGRMTGFSANEKNADGADGTYYEVTVTVQFRYPYNTTAAKAWYARVLHQGHRLNTGEIKSSPVLLTSAGAREEDPASADFLEFQIYDSLPYNALGLF